MAVGRSLFKTSGFDAGRILRLLVNLFFVVCAVVLSYGVKSVFFEEEKFLKKESEEGISAVLEQVPAAIERKQHDYSLFLNQIQNRDIFTPVQTQKALPVLMDELNKVKKIIEGLKLVGIKSGDVPKVIIEDKQAGKTFYLKEGDSFSENIVVEKIGKNSVAVTAAEESFELYL